jgi:hypothetical protein
MWAVPAVILNRPTTRRIPALAVAGMVAAGLLGGCSPSGAGQLLTSSAGCPVSPTNNFSNVTAPNYGFGTGPVYLAGQDGWYSGGQVAVLMVDPKYTGPLLVRAAQHGGAGASTITLSDLPSTDMANIAAKESQHSVVLVSGVNTPEGGLQLPADLGTPSWRAWYGWLSTSGTGCFELQVSGESVSEVIVIAVQGGPPPPG